MLNYLPSPVKGVNVSFLVPVNVTDASGREIRVVDVFRPMASVEGRQLTCSIETGYFLAGVSVYSRVVAAWNSDGISSLQY